MHVVTTKFCHVVIVTDFKLNDLKHSGESVRNLTYGLLHFAAGARLPTVQPAAWALILQL